MRIVLLLEALKPQMLVSDLSTNISWSLNFLFCCCCCCFYLFCTASPIPHLPDLSFIVWATLCDNCLHTQTVCIVYTVLGTARVNSMFLTAYFVFFPSQPENIQPSQNKFTHKLQVRICMLVKIYNACYCSILILMHTFWILVLKQRPPEHRDWNTIM